MITDEEAARLAEYVGITREPDAVDSAVCGAAEFARTASEEATKPDDTGPAAEDRRRRRIQKVRTADLLGSKPNCPRSLFLCSFIVPMLELMVTNNPGQKVDAVFPQGVQRGGAVRPAHAAHA